MRIVSPISLYSRNLLFKLTAHAFLNAIECGLIRLNLSGNYGPQERNSIKWSRSLARIASNSILTSKCHHVLLIFGTLSVARPWIRLQPPMRPSAVPDRGAVMQRINSIRHMQCSCRASFKASAEICTLKPLIIFADPSVRLIYECYSSVFDARLVGSWILAIRTRQI